MGLWQPDCAGAAETTSRSRPARPKAPVQHQRRICLFARSRPIELRAKSAVFSSLADAILVSGPLTGHEVDAPTSGGCARPFRRPVFANTGVKIDNVRDIFAVADGWIIGTHFKVDGDTWNPVDGERVKRFMDVVGKMRKTGRAWTLVATCAA